MNIALPILLLYIAGSFDGFGAPQGIPRFLWTPVVKPYEFLPKVDGSDPRQRTFDSKSNTSMPFTMGTPYLITEQGSITIDGKKVNTIDTFWVYPYTPSDDRVGLSAKKPFVVESKVMNRSYTDPTTNKRVFQKDIPNEHSNKSGVRRYSLYDELLFSRLYGNYFISPAVNRGNLTANLNVTNNIWKNPTRGSNLFSTRNIKEVMKLGDLRRKIRLINRLGLHESYLFMNSEGILVQ
jgi:hypothetical protein